MAFQAMNHGLEARATSRPRIRATHNVKADRVLGETSRASRWSHEKWRGRAAFGQSM